MKSGNIHSTFIYILFMEKLYYTQTSIFILVDVKI